MKNPEQLGSFEMIVMAAIMHLRENAYGTTIRQKIEERANRSTSVGALYTTLERLEKKGYLKHRDSDPTPERGGRAKRYFSITGLGQSTFQHSKDTLDSMCDGLPVGI